MPNQWCSSIPNRLKRLLTYEMVRASVQNRSHCCAYEGGLVVMTPSALRQHDELDGVFYGQSARIA